MAKISKEPIVVADLNGYLEVASDFAFELKVLSAVKSAGIECEHGGVYEDPVTKKTREFDIRAIATNGGRRVRLSIECKNIREYFPILVSCVPRQSKEAFHQIAFMRDPDYQEYSVSAFESRATIVDVARYESLYPPGQYVGKSTSQVGKRDKEIYSQDKDLFEKWSQALSSCSDLVYNMYRDADEDDDQDGYLSAIIPIVVVPNGRLWSVNYNEDGEKLEDPKQVERCPCYVGKEYKMDRLSGAYFRISHIEIMTLDGLAVFLNSHLSSTEAMDQIFPLDFIKKALKVEMEE